MSFKHYAGISLSTALIALMIALAFFYGVYLLYGLAVIAGLLALRFIVMPVIKQGAEVAETVVSIRLRVNEHNTIMRQSANFFQIAPDQNGNYAQLVDARTGKLVTYLRPGNAPVAQLPAPDYSVEEDNVVDADTIEAEDTDELPQIASPTLVKLSTLLRSGYITAREETSIIGMVNGKPMRGTLFEVQENTYNSVFTVGDQGYGKSSFAVYMAALTVLHGGRLLIIDPDADTSQSLTARLGPLVSNQFLLAPVAETPEQAEKVLAIAEREMARPGEYPVLLLVDELSLIARHAEVNMGAWASVGKRVLSVCEDYATRGRKRRRRAIVMGQFTQGKRNGGTTLRYAMATMVFRVDKKQAMLVLDTHEAALVPNFKAGEVFVIPSRSSEPKVRMQNIYPDADGLQMIVDIMYDNLEDALSSTFQGHFETSPQDTESTLESVEMPPENVRSIPPEMAYRAKLRRVREMRSQGMKQGEIIAHLWGVSPGGSKEYAKAREEYLSMIEQLSMEA